MRILHSSLCAAAAAVLLAGCAARGESPVSAAPPPPPPVAICDAAAANFIVGQRVSVSLEVAARTRAGASTSRVLRPGQAVTMEFNGARLNIVVDAGDRVTDVRCG